MGSLRGAVAGLLPLLPAPAPMARVLLSSAPVAAAFLLLWPAPAPAEELVLAGAVSLREPLEAVLGDYRARHPEDRVDLALGASSFLAAQIRAGAPVDVFASADARIVDALVGEGRVAEDAHAVLARNRLVVVRARGLSAELRTADDLRGPAVRRIAVPDGAVPVGRYAREWLAARGLLDALAPRLVPTEHARATLAAVDDGHADAAIVYATDARVARSARVAFAVPADEQPDILYAAARVGEGRGAGRLYAFLLSDASRQRLRDAGFADP